MENLRAGAVVSFVLCIICLSSTSVVAGSSDSIEDILPSTLQLPQGNKVQQALLGTGVQIYNYNGTAWVLKNVSADLYNFKGLKVGYHFYLAEEDVNGGQPSWETFHPFSRVTGKRVAGVAQSDAIDWVLLQATSHEGKKLLALTTYIQRVFTQHGLPPVLDGSAEAGEVFKSNYTALYIFSAKN